MTLPRKLLPNITVATNAATHTQTQRVDVNVNVGSERLVRYPSSANEGSVESDSFILRTRNFMLELWRKQNITLEEFEHAIQTLTGAERVKVVIDETFSTSCCSYQTSKKKIVDVWVDMEDKDGILERCNFCELIPEYEFFVHLGLKDVELI